MYLAVFHLLAHGHKNITFVGLNPDLYTMMERYKGYASAMRAARLPENAYLDASRGSFMMFYTIRSNERRLVGRGAKFHCLLFLASD